MELIHSAMYQWLVCSVLLTRLALAAELYHHRLNHAVVIVGEYLYIDGGEIATWNGTGDGLFGTNECQGYDGLGCPGNITLTAENNTYSIDLAYSWTNATVILNAITKTVPVVKGECLWGIGNSFYSYGGDTGGPGGLSTPPDNNLWQFTISDHLGSWSTVSLNLEAQNFTSLPRTQGSGCASGRGLGFSLGGIIADGQGDGNTLTPGMIMYNSSSQLWFNASAFDYALGATHFVPSFGPEGLVVAIAGATPRGGNGNRVLLNTDTINVYEPVSQQWRTQAVTGSRPSPRIDSCVAGAQGDNDTYEIFVYGGSLDTGDNSDDQNTATSIELGSTYVLSLPSFNWFKADYVPQFGRWGHKCGVVGRQMISVGGVVMTQDAASSDSADGSDGDLPVFEHSVPDPWDNGISVFDCSEMVWKDGYDPAAGPYITPQVVKQYYASNPRYPSSFADDPELRSWFVRETNTTSLRPSPTPTPAKHKSDTGAIAGGVVGGILCLAIIAGTIWWFMRRTSKLKRSPPQYRKPELENTNHNFEARQPPGETHGHALQEMESSQLHEMDSPRLHEMEGSRASRIKA